MATGGGTQARKYHGTNIRGDKRNEFDQKSPVAGLIQ